MRAIIALVLALTAGAACAQEVGNYPNATTPLAGNERLIADQGGNTVNITPAMITGYAFPSGGLTVPLGGTGATSLTGIIRGNGTSAFTPATAADVYNLFSGSPSISCYLNGGGGCTTPSGAGTVTISGSPVAPNIAAFSAPTVITAATAANIVALFTGCTGSEYLGADGACHAAVGSGTVTSAALTMPGIFSVAGSPITTSGTFAVTPSGTSGGIPFFSSSITMGSSALLTASQLLLGGGPGNPPVSLGSLGTTTQVYHGNASGAGSFSAVNFATDGAGLVQPANGGTGVANSNTISLGSNLITLGTGPLTFTTTASTNMTLPPGSFTAGYLGLPPCTASSNAAAQACPLTAGTSFLLPANSQWITINCGSACTMTISAHTTTLFPLGACLVFQTFPGSAVVTLSIGGSDTMTVNGTGATGNRTLTAPAGITECQYATGAWIGYPSGGVT